MASTKGLNPLAPEYLPVFHVTSIFPQSHIDQLALVASQLIPVPPSSHITFAYPTQPPPYVPTYVTPVCRELFHSSTFSFQPELTSNFFPLASPPTADVPPSSVAVSLSVVATDQDEFVPRVITGRKFLSKPLRVRFERGGSRTSRRERGESGRKSTLTDSGRNGEGFERGCNRERKAIESWSYLKKHEMLPLRRDEEKTTVMVKNIPYEYTRGMLMEFLDEHCMSANQKVTEGSYDVAGQDRLSAYDFLYLPMDFKTKKNKGYAFLNFTQSRAAWNFFHAFNETKWDFNNSTKIRRIVSARIQGKEALVKHFEKSSFECESDEFLPVCFNPPRDGFVKLAGVLIVVGNRRGTSHREER